MHLLRCNDAMQLLPCFVDTRSVSAVDDVDQALRSVVVVPPERTNFVLAADVPHGEAEAFDRLDRLHVEADRRDGADDLVQLELVQNGRLARCVQTQHKNASLRHAQLVEELFQTTQPHTHLELRMKDKP